MFARIRRLERRKAVYGDRKNPYPVNFSDVHGARPGFVGLSLLIAAVLIHLLCCDWNVAPERQRARIVGPIYASKAFIYASQVGEPVYNTRLAALFGLAIPGLLASGGTAVLGFLLYRKAASRWRARRSRSESPIPSDHLRARASRIHQP